MALALWVAACATGAPRERGDLPDEARRLMALLTSRRDEFSDLRTIVDVTIRRGGTTQKLSGVLLAKPPTSLRFEALSPFGQPFLLLTLSDGTLTTYNVADNRALRGPANIRTTTRWLGVPLEAEDVVGLLIGRVVPSRGLRGAEILPADPDGPSVKLTAEDRSQRIWMDFESGEVRKAEIKGDRTTLVVRYARGGDDGLPAALHATASGADFEATVRYRDPALATGVEAERFHLAVPEGANLQPFH